MRRRISIFWYVVIGIIFPQEILAEARTLILDHLFVYKNPMVNYRISVQGKIPIDWTMQGFTPCLNRHDQVDLCEAIAWSGNGRVDIQGQGSMNPGGGFTVNKINYDSSMSVTVNGINRYMKAPKDRGEGSIVVHNLELKENWEGSFKWDIKTSDSKNDSIRLKMLKRIVPQKIPDSPHTGKTVEFDESSLEFATYEYVTSNPMGTFRWRYILAPSKGIKALVNDSSQANFSDDSIKPKDYHMPEGRLGPPLDQIQREITMGREGWVGNTELSKVPSREGWVGNTDISKMPKPPSGDVNK